MRPARWRLRLSAAACLPPSWLWPTRRCDRRRDAPGDRSDLPHRTGQAHWGLARVVRSVDLAEELAQDALAIALSEWPRSGVPANPGAWLTATAKRRAIDAFRRDRMRERKHAEIAREQEGEVDDADVRVAMDDDLGDELLGLIFTACHPILSPDARAALTLRVIGGLTTDEIARAFLSNEATIAQRIVRAKKTIGKAGLRFEVPRGAERAARLSSVLEVIYLIFNEGYAATAGDDLVRHLGRYRLAPHRDALRPAAGCYALAGGRSQSGGRAQHGLRTRSGSAAGRRDRRCRRPAQLCAIASGERRLPVSGRPTGRGPFRIRSCGQALQQRTGKGLSPRPRKTCTIKLAAPGIL